MLQTEVRTMGCVSVMLCSFCFIECYSPFIPSPFIPVCSSHSEICVCQREDDRESMDACVCEREREMVVNGLCLTQRSSDKPLVTCVFNSRDCSQWMCPPDVNDCRQVVLRGHRKASFCLNIQGWMRCRSFDSLWVHLPRWHGVYGGEWADP